ncbi:MAG: hypothetical protein O7D91_12670 [Planctomycetota bacterium]|nr:hypothetical protein [Planctomycetota bacterium]
MAKFQVQGPFEVPVYRGSAGRIIGASEGRRFFQAHKAHEKRVGCYIFGMRAGRGMTPAYVGKATKGFGQECFTPHKLEKYNQCLVDYERGTPILFFLELPNRRGATNVKHVKELESFLVQIGVASNVDLLNVQGTRVAEWSITGVLRGGSGVPSRAAKEFKKLMNL